MVSSKPPVKEIKRKVFEALDSNLNYHKEKILGIPASYLDQEQLYFDAPFLKDAAFLSVWFIIPITLVVTLFSRVNLILKERSNLSRFAENLCWRNFWCGKKSVGWICCSRRNWSQYSGSMDLPQLFSATQKSCSRWNCTCVFVWWHYSVYKGSKSFRFENIVVPVNETEAGMKMNWMLNCWKRK